MEVSPDVGWHQLSGPHPEHGERGRYAKAGREGILMIREKKKFVIKSWQGNNVDDENKRE